MTPDEFERLDPGAKQEAIDKANAEKVWYGFCQACRCKIEALLKDWPEECPRCGFNGNTDEH